MKKTKFKYRLKEINYNHSGEESLLDLAMELVAEEGDKTPEELAYALNISVEEAQELINQMDNGEIDETKQTIMNINEIKRMNKLAGLLKEESEEGSEEEYNEIEARKTKERQEDAGYKDSENPEKQAELSEDTPDEIGKFWVVTKPQSKDATLEDILFESSVMYFANQIRGGLNEADVRGLFYSKPKATKLAKSLLKEFEDQLEEVEGAMSEFRTHKGELDKHKENARTLINKIKNIGTDEAKD